MDFVYVSRGFTTFNMDKITAYEVISYSAIKHTDLQTSNENFPKSFPKLLDKLIPNHFQEKERDIIETILSNLIEPKSACINCGMFCSYNER